jgi:hypothetical protein
MDKKQKREISDIESFFGVKGLKEENIITKAQLSLTFIGNELFICKSFVNNLDCKYGEKAEIICREFVNSLVMSASNETTIFYLMEIQPAITLEQEIFSTKNYYNNN